MATCTDCQTVVVALQLNLYERSATDVQPQNVAWATNVQCTRCATLALAIQYALPVDDPNASRGDVDELIREIDHELQDIHNGQGMTTDEVEARLNDVINRFVSLADGLNKQRAASTAQDDPTPTPTATGTVTPTMTVTPTGTTVPTASPVGTGGASAPALPPAGAAVEATPTATSLLADTSNTSPSSTTPTTSATPTPVGTPSPSP
jgi:hypothetical protein